MNILAHINVANSSANQKRKAHFYFYILWIMGHRCYHKVETLIVIQPHFLFSFFFHLFTVQKEISGTIMHSCIHIHYTPFRYPKVKILSAIIIKRWTNNSDGSTGVRKINYVWILWKKTRATEATKGHCVLWI